ncbi:MAG: universal stress protein [Solirubrobacteraceae bacterium]|jgi:nucleotide-binding universal stress UspA family protein
MFEAIVVGTDGSEPAREAVRQAVELARLTGAHAHLVCAYEPAPSVALRDPGGERPDAVEWALGPPREMVDATLEEAAQAFREAGVNVDLYARRGDAADALLDVAEERGADLIVVGNRGTTGRSRFLLGSVPDKISHHAPCAVLIIRTPLSS